MNEHKDKCIPLPGNYIPFPFIITCGILTIPVLISWLYRKQTRFITNLIIAYSFIETIAILV